MLHVRRLVNQSVNFPARQYVRSSSYPRHSPSVPATSIPHGWMKRFNERINERTSMIQGRRGETRYSFKRYESK